MRDLAVDARMWHASGIGTYLRNLVPRLARAHPETRFTLLGPAGRPPETRLPNVAYRVCDAPIYGPREHWAVPRALPAGTALLWVPHFNTPFGFRGRLVATVHDLFHLALPELAGRVASFAARALLRHTHRRARAILTPSRFSAGELERFLGPRDGVHVTPLGVDPAWFDATADRAAGPPYLLFVGNVKPHKNLPGLLAAFERLAPQLPHELRIVGRKEGFVRGDPEVLRRAEAFGDRVRFSGEIDDAALRRTVAGAAALVHPSYYEGFGLPPLEAMACGCPVVVSDRASLPEVCGDAALYVDPDDPDAIAAAVLRLLRDPEVRADRIARGRERAAGFSWDRTAEATWRVLTEAAA